MKRDHIILNSLLNDSRMELSQISKEHNIPVSSVFDRLQKMRNDKKLIKFYSEIDPQYLRFPIRMFFVIKGEIPEDFKINNSYALSDIDHYLLDMHFKDLKDIDRFKKALIKKRSRIVKNFKIYEILKENTLILN